MRLLFKQKLFSWLDSYDVFNESGETVYKVKGQLSWGHCFKIYDSSEQEIGMVKQKIFSFLPRYEIYFGEQYVGSIYREFSLLRPKYNIDYNGWRVEGNFLEWDYAILNDFGVQVASVSKQLWNWTDTYAIDIDNPNDALSALMLVIAIDAEKCSRDK